MSQVASQADIESARINTLTKNTSITVGLAVSILVTIVGGIGAGAWWAATVTSQMAQVTNISSDNSRRITVLEQSTLKTEHIRPLVRSLVEEMEMAK
jgi:hypothetical protein